MRYVLALLAASFSIPAYAEVYTYDFTGTVDTNSLLGIAGDTFHGTFSFNTETPILWDLGDDVVYRATEDLNLAPKLTYIRDHDGFTII